MKLLFAAMLLILAGCSQSGGSPAASGGSASTAPSNSTAVIVKDFKIEPADIKVQSKTVSLAVTNQGPTIHNVAIRDASGAVIVTTRDLKTGESETISATLAPGSYILFCSLPGHESLGTKGTLEVSP